MNTTKALPADYGAMSVMARMMTKAALMGLDRSTRKMEFAEPTVEEIENLPYAEAVEYLKKRDVLKKVDYDRLSDRLKFRAFTASRISDGALLKRINRELIKNIEDGDGLKDFLKLTKTDVLSKVGMENAAGWYWETVYRTNAQTAYNAGRMMGYEEDKPLALELVVIDDARTTDICRQYAGGFVRPYDDPFWKTHIPPFHFNCRTTVRGIYDESELPESWSSKAEIENPAKGFGENPVTGDSWWKELESQVRQAKEYNVQKEIEAAKRIFIDKLEMETGKKIQVLGINLFDKTDPIYFDAFQIEEEDGFLDIYIHGSPTSVQTVIDGKLKNLDVNQFVEYLKVKGYKGGDIRLAACSSGYGDNSFAQQLSKELGIKVKAAPMDVYFIPEDGILRIGSPFTNMADWRIFDNGVELK